MKVRISFIFACLLLAQIAATTNLSDPDQIKTDEEAREEADKRGKWQGNNMAMWGKRNAGNLKLWIDQNDDRKQSIKKWNRKKWTGRQMAMWGKRADDEAVKKWSGKDMAMWGKRNIDDFDEKRSSGKEMPMWGKRAPDSKDMDKKRWTGKQMPMWGKRASNSIDIGEKKWTGKEMPMWGKRSVDSDMRIKRWSGKDMAMWGKRADEEFLDSENTDYQPDGDKRWTGKEMPMWGKRDENDYSMKNNRNIFSNRSSVSNSIENSPQFREGYSADKAAEIYAKNLSDKIKLDFSDDHSIDDGLKKNYNLYDS